MIPVTEETLQNPNTQPAIPYAGLWLALACILLYGKFLNNPWAFDDMYMFNDIKLLKAYSEKVFFDFSLRWFSYVTFGWTYKLAGVNLFWHRVVNLAFHAGVVFSLYVFLIQLFKQALADTDRKNNAMRYAFWGAIIFAVHPMSVYGEGYLIERSIIMATLFAILTLLSFLKGLSGNGRKWYYVAGLWYFVAVFSKEHAVMLPFVLLALVPLVRNDYRALARELLFPAALYFGIALLVLLKARGILGTPYEPYAMEMLSKISETKGGMDVVANAHSLSILLQAFLFFKYLVFWLVPNISWMSIDLQQKFPDTLFQFPEIIGVIAFAIYPLTMIWLLRKGGRRGLLGFALICPWLLFFTEFTTVRMVESFVLYRSYLWMICLPAALPVFLGNFDPRRESAALIVTVVVLAALSWNRLDTFTSDLKLWDDVVAKLPNEKTPSMYRAYLNRGVAYAVRSQNSEALQDLNRAVELNPKSASSWVSRGALKNNMDQFADAYADLTQAMEIDPKFSGAYANRALSQVNLGNKSMGLNDIHKALELEPDNKGYLKILLWAQDAH